MSEYKCPECGVGEGEYHDSPCGHEICPFCGGRLCDCDCNVKQLGLYNQYKHSSRTGYLPEKVFYDGLSPEQEARWFKILAKGGRIPYMYYGLFCDRCGSELDHNDLRAIKYGSFEPNYVCTDCEYQMVEIMGKTAEKRAAWIDFVSGPAVTQASVRKCVEELLTMGSKFSPEVQKEHLVNGLVAYLQSKLLTE